MNLIVIKCSLECKISNGSRNGFDIITKYDAIRFCDSLHKFRTFTVVSTSEILNYVEAM